MRRQLIAGMALVAMVAVVSTGAEPARQPAQSGKPIALVGGTLIDGFGGPPIRNSVVLVRGERIAAVGQVGALAVPADFEVISTEGMSVLPGLWDMHVHLMINGHSDYTHWDKTYPARLEKEIMPASARQLLMAGVTSARDLGGPLEAEPQRARRDQPRRDSGRDDVRLGPVPSARAVPGHRALPLGPERTRRRAGEGQEARGCGRRRHQADRSGSDDGRRGQRRHRRSAQAQPAGDRARASARGDPARAEVRRRRSSSTRVWRPRRSIRRTSSRPSGAHGEDVARTVSSGRRRSRASSTTSTCATTRRCSTIRRGRSASRRTSSRTSASRFSIRGR